MAHTAAVNAFFDVAGKLLSCPAKWLKLDSMLKWSEETSGMIAVELLTTPVSSQPKYHFCATVKPVGGCFNPSKTS